MDKADPEMREAMEAAAVKFKEAGAEVKDVMLPDDFDLTWPTWTLVCRSELNTYHAKHAAALEADGVEVTPDASCLIPANFYLQAQRIRRHLFQEMQAVFGEVDFLYTPAAVELARPRWDTAAATTSSTAPGPTWGCRQSPSTSA